MFSVRLVSHLELHQRAEAKIKKSRTLLVSKDASECWLFVGSLCLRSFKSWLGQLRTSQTFKCFWKHSKVALAPAEVPIAMRQETPSCKPCVMSALLSTLSQAVQVEVPRPVQQLDHKDNLPETRIQDENLSVDWISSLSAQDLVLQHHLRAQLQFLKTNYRLMSETSWYARHSSISRIAFATYWMLNHGS